MKNYFMLAFMALALTANAQEEKKTTIEVPAWVKNVKFSGYGMLQYQGSDQDGAESNTFKLRLARFILDGKIGDFDWRAQIQGTNATGPGQPTVQLVDLYAEWRKYPEFKIRAGQFKRAFTYENPTHPITQGWRGYADVINNLSGFGDRTGEKSSGGRDIGIQFSGDLFPAADGHRFLHYQVGIYNGEGVNETDKDNRKDIIGGLWVMPIKGLRIGAFGWTGSRGNMTVDYAKDANGNYILDSEGNKTAITGSVAKNRYAFSAEYSQGEYMFRAEYRMPLVLCPSSRVSCTLKLATSAIVPRRNGIRLRHLMKQVSTTSSPRTWRCTLSMPASTTASWRSTTTTSLIWNSTSDSKRPF